MFFLNAFNLGKEKKKKKKSVAENCIQFDTVLIVRI